MIEYFVTKRPVEIKKEINNMPDSNFEDGDNLTKEQKHEKIQALLDEIKGFEDKFPGYAIKEPEIIEEEVHFGVVIERDSAKDSEKELKSEMELEKRLGKKVDLLTYGGINHLLRERILNEEMRII